MKEQTSQRTITVNRKAYHDYYVDETYEAGVELVGTEVKSLRNGGVNLKDSYCRVINGELFAIGIHISPYEKGNVYNHDPLRMRRLLMHKREINKLNGMLTQKGYSLIPLSLYFNGSKVKVNLGLCRGKKLYDKREVDAKKEAKREIERAHKMNHRI